MDGRLNMSLENRRNDIDRRYSKVPGEKSVPLPLFSPQILHGLA
jgi:hypothetical protein